MNKGFFLAALAACGALALAAAWQAHAPRDAAAPVIPRKADAESARPLQQPLALETGAAAPAADACLPAPPPPPLVAINPETEGLVVRVIDADTNRPLADTECVLHHAYFYTTCCGYGFNFTQDDPATRRTTDDDGTMRLKGGKYEGRWEAEEAGAEVAYVDSEEHWRPRVVVLRLPAPEGWWPIDGCSQAAAKLAEGFASGRVVDLFVRRTATLYLTMRDRYGSVIDGAEFELTAISEHYEHSEWIDEYHDWIDTTEPDYWEYQKQEWLAHGRKLAVQAAFSTGEVPFAGPCIVIPSPEESRLRKHEGLPTLRFGVRASHPAAGAAFGEIELKPGRNFLDVQVPLEPQATLGVRVEKLGNGFDDDDTLDVELSTTGPFGCICDETLDYQKHGWEFEGTSGNAWTGTINGLQSGWWLLSCEARGWESALRFELHEGESRQVTLYVGEGAEAKWAPAITLDGRLLSGVTVLLLGGSDDEPDKASVETDPESGVEPIALSPGTWTAWIPGFPPRTFTLAPGEARTDAFELASQPVTLTLDEGLAQLLSPDDGEVSIQLSHAISGNHEGMGRVMLVKGNDDNTLAPGKPLEWRLPPGKYEWRLRADDSLCGELEVRAGEPAHFRFGLDGAPGLACLKICREGFEPEENFRVRVSSVGLWDRVADVCHDYGPDCNLEDRTGSTREINVLSAADGLTAYAFGPPGPVTALVGDYYYAASLPGELIARPVQELPATSLMLVAEDNDDLWYEAEMFLPHAGRIDCRLNGKLALPLGPVHLRIVRRNYRLPERRMYSWADVDLVLGAVAVKIELKSLDYQEFANVDFWFRGRASGEHDDPWWTPDNWHSPYLVALDDKLEGESRLCSLGEVSDLSLRRLEFGFRGRLLKPGRYRVVPWEGAPEKHWREFTVEAGQSKVVIVEVK